MSGSRTQQINTMARRCRAIASFLAEKRVTSLQRWLATIEATERLGRVGPMRLLASELTNMANATLREGDRKILEEQLLQALGIDAAAERRQIRARIEIVIKRGAIASEDEYRMMRAYLDEIEGGDTDIDMVDVLRGLLERFELGQ